MALPPGPSSVGLLNVPAPSTRPLATDRRSPRRAPRPATSLRPDCPRASLPRPAAQTQSTSTPMQSRKSVGEVSRLHLGLRIVRLHRLVFESRRRQKRRPLMFMRAFLYFHLREKHRRRHGGNRHTSALRAAHAVKNMLLVARRYDSCQCRQRRAHNIHSAHQFVRPAVGINLVHNYRQHLKRLRQRSCGQRKSALNIIEIKSVWLILFLHFVYQLLPHLLFGNRLRRAHDQIPLPARRHQSWLIPSMSIRMFEPLDWHPRRQEISQHAVLNHFHSARRHAFVVILLRACKFYSRQFALRRIVRHTQKLRQHFLSDLFRQRLPFVFVLLP